MPGKRGNTKGHIRQARVIAVAGRVERIQSSCYVTQLRNRVYTDIFVAPSDLG
jgi:hypothetical protein